MRYSFHIANIYIFSYEYVTFTKQLKHNSKYISSIEDTSKIFRKIGDGRVIFSSNIYERNFTVNMNYKRYYTMILAK